MTPKTGRRRSMAAARLSIIMNTIIVKPALSDSCKQAAAAIERQVFSDELGIVLPNGRSSAGTPAFQLLAETSQFSTPVGSLSVVDTTDNDGLHEQFGLVFDKGARVARLTRLAVLRPYRGQGIPLKLMREAYRLFVWPRHFEFTWLTFDAAKAKSCSYCSVLDYQMGSKVFDAEYGRVRVLLRKEAAQALTEGAYAAAGKSR
jgi:GNAT superfamily N-acetyltransferase